MCDVFDDFEEIEEVPNPGLEELSTPGLDDSTLDDELNIPSEDLDDLQGRADGLDRDDDRGEITLGAKICATRHGCTGATNCDYDYGAPIGR